VSGSGFGEYIRLQAFLIRIVISKGFIDSKGTV
jgi:hypothetical protein